MDLGWKVPHPAVARWWLLILGAINVGRDEGWNLDDRGRGRLRRDGGGLRPAHRRHAHGPGPPRRSSKGWVADGPARLRPRASRVTAGKLVKSSDSGRMVTVPYVKDSGPKREKPERLHGRHVLNRYEDGMEKCIGCGCAGVCPAKCIYVRGADNPVDDPVSPGERYGFVYEINYLRCIHCDLCVEACPTEAITESKLHSSSPSRTAGAIYTKAELGWWATTACPATAVGGLERPRTRSPPTRPPGSGPPPPRAAPRLRGRGRLVGRARVRREGARGRSARRAPRCEKPPPACRGGSRRTTAHGDHDHGRRRWARGGH